MDDLGDLGFISRGQGQNEIGPYNPQAERGGEAVNVVVREGWEFYQNILGLPLDPCC